MGAFVAKNSDATSWHELLHHYDRFAPSFVSQPNGPQCTKTVRNAPKHEFRVQLGGSGAFVAKNLEATSWHELLHQFGPFCTEFRNSTVTNAPKLYKTHQNMSSGSNGGGLGALVAKNSYATSYHELLYQFGPFCTEFSKSTKLSQMHQNCTKMHQNISFGSNEVERVRSLQKIPTPLRGTNFCTSSAHFASSFVSQLNGPKCTQI